MKHSIYLGKTQCPGRRSKFRLSTLLFYLCLAGSLQAFDEYTVGALRLHPTLNVRIGLQHGWGINYGLGAYDSLGETERATFYGAAKPQLDLNWELERSEFYAGVSVAAATTQLDGEISGQVARAGDTAIDTDHAFVGWRNEVVDFSVGGQEYWVGDGFIVGDGNFNMGDENGQYWTGAFVAWRNSAILKVNTTPLRAEVFWLRTDSDFRDGRVVGINIETNKLTFGTFGAMYLEVLEGGAYNLDGINAWNLRAANVQFPGLSGLHLFGELVVERGTDADGGGHDNDALGWYLEAQYTLARVAWKPVLTYRYTRLSGDELATPENEEYRGLYFTIFKRDWDTWYQGEIAGEYHLFNQNQITQMVKLKAFPRPSWAVTAYYYHHDLEEPHYFGTPVTDTSWADEINLGIEYFLGQRFYGYAGIAWSTPGDAVKQLLGEDDFTVIQTYLSYTF